MPLLGFIALNDIITGKADQKLWLNGLKWAFIITGGLALLFAMLPGLAGSFTNAMDTQVYPDWLIDGVIADRKNLLRSDAFRSFIFIAVAAGALYIWHIKKINTTTFIAVLGVAILIDLWAVDKRYLNNDDFVPKRQAETPFPMTPADEAILKDKDLYYRVLALPNPFQDARASFFHKNVGGYHAAKLRRYQEIIDYHLQPELQQMANGLQSGLTIDSVFNRLTAMNMLNTRYIIYDLNQQPIMNPHALGNAWFVSGYKLVQDADEEIAALQNLNPSETAVINDQFSEFVEQKSFSNDRNGSISLVEYQPNSLKYNFNAQSEQLTVFSDVYYKKDWHAYLNGEPVPHFRVNYILRGMVVPAGSHTIEFRFEPSSYYRGNYISMASSFLLILLVAGYFLNEYRKKKPIIKEE
jgi:hypothetical protein